jgi:hypothetical protein
LRTYQLQSGEGVGGGDVAAEFAEDLLPDLVLPLWVRAEQEHGPHEEGGGGLLPGAEEGLALVDHLSGGQRRRRPFVVAPSLAPPRLRRPRLQQEAEQVVAVATATIGGHPRCHHRRDLGPQQLVQTSHR